MIVHLSSCCKIDVFRVLAMVHILIRIHWPLTEIHPQSTARSTIKKITTTKFSEEKRESNRRSQNWTIKHGQQDSMQSARLVSLSYNITLAVPGEPLQCMAQPIREEIRKLNMNYCHWDCKPVQTKTLCKIGERWCTRSKIITMRFQW